MNPPHRWTPCVAHRGDEVDDFVRSYFGRLDRNIFLVSGAGFDPRSCILPARLAGADVHMRALLIQEKRPEPAQDQRRRADANRRNLDDTLVTRQFQPVDIFGLDNAVVGGRNIIATLRQQCLEGMTDIIVDVSALSIGTSFPIIKYFMQHVAGSGGSVNLHIFVVHAPCVDAGIVSIDSDAPSYIHGFKGRATLSDSSGSAKLWLPHLAANRNATLERLFDFIEPDQTCPIIPFPASNPRLGDALAAEYMTEFEETWLVDTRNVVYADEGDPLDLYRTILRLDDLRKPVFAETGGSMLIVSPIGGKVMALGALMAALDRNLPVAYLEAIDYDINESIPEEISQPSIVHLWLEGDVYPQPRPPIIL